MRSLSDAPAMVVGAHRQTSTASAQRGAIPDSPAMRGGAQERSRLNRGVGRRHTARSRARTRPRRWEARARTRPRRWEARANKDPQTCRSPPHRAEPHQDSPATEGGAHRQASIQTRGEPVAATSHRAIAGLAREMGGAHRHHQHANTQAVAEVDAVA